LIDKEGNEGIEVNWRDGKVLVQLTEKITKLEGISQYFKEGIIDAVKRIGSNVMDSIVHVKNLNYPCYLFCQDTLYVFTIKGLGRIYQQAEPGFRSSEF
jgi:hypothetical protein